MPKVVVFEDVCSDIQEWDEFNEKEIKEYTRFNERIQEGDDQYTTIDWITPSIVSVPFCEGPHFIFIKQ